MNIVAIIQARMGSSRLPGKVLKKVLGRHLLEYMIERVAKSNQLDAIVVATTTSPQDDTIAEFCNQFNVNCFRGAEDDVLSRYYETSKKFNADLVVRLCADSPLIDHRIIDSIIMDFLSKENRCDYLSNTINQTYPLGMNVEVFRRSALEIAHNFGTGQSEREHVTPYIYRHPEIFNICQVHAEYDMKKMRLTVDEIEDYYLVKEIIERLYQKNKEFSLSDIIRLYESDVELFNINAHIKQNKSPYSNELGCYRKTSQ